MDSLASVSPRVRPARQSNVILPYELKLIVFKNCDIDSLKALRLVSKSWAEVGLDVLLLPNFVVSPRKCDIQRLLDISQHPTLSVIAAKTIKSLEFLNNDWDLPWFRNLFSNRVESTADITPNSFVPTEDERKALDELDDYEANMVVVQADCSIDRLAMAFKAVPNYHTIKIVPRCVFRHRLLKKTWNEYAPGLIIRSTRKPQVERLLKAAELANLYPRHLIIEELSSRFASASEEPDEFPNTIKSALKELETFYLRIEDASDVMGESSHIVSDMVKRMLSLMPKIKSVSLYIASCTESWPTSILPGPETWPHLESIYLASAQTNGQEFLSQLEAFRPTLKRLQILGIKITSGEMRWKAFLGRLRDALNLERFQLAWSIRYDVAGQQEETWHLRPHCDEHWNLHPKGEGSKSWELEKFVLEDGPWPMTAEDNGQSFY